jgi:hypothetical protein
MNYDDATSVQIHLTPGARRRAALALYSQGKLTAKQAWNFTGPHFIAPRPEAIVDGAPTGLEVAIGATTVNVVLEEGTVEYIYPMSQVVRIKITA